MIHDGPWHAFNADDASTYPKGGGPVRVRYADGSQLEGDLLKLVSNARVRSTAEIWGWRYIRDKNIR